MKTNKLNTSVGIVAFNEQNNIRNIISDILSQRQTYFKLNKIYIACGGCTDNTVSIVRSIKSSKIKLIINPNREGKAIDEQKIFNEFKDVYLVMFDADVRLNNKNVINDLIRTISMNKNTALVGGNARPYKPKTFFERSVYSTFKILDKSRNELKGGNNIYGASGQCLVLEKKLVKNIKFPRNIIAEDDFIYFTNMKLGNDFKYCSKAIVWYKLPKNLVDYFRQVLRADPLAASLNVQTYFGDIVQKEYKRPMRFYLKEVIKVYFSNPLEVSLAISVRIISKFVVPFSSKRYKLEWFTASSTK